MPTRAPEALRARSAHYTTGIQRIPTTGIQRIPAELVTEILGYLDQDDLWRAAAVCRTFYLSAWSAGLHIHRRICLLDGEISRDLALLRKIVQHTLQHALPFSFELCALRDLFYPEVTKAERVSAISAVLSEVTRALPTLVFLSLHVDLCHIPLVYEALRHPAPRLEDFGLFGYEIIDHVHTVPGDLFLAYAPRLRRVSLCDVHLGKDSVPAFSRSSYCDITYDYSDFPDIDFSRHFPCLRSLRLVCSGDPLPKLPSFQLAGVSLQRLVIEDPMSSTLLPALSRALDLRDVPALEHQVDILNWAEPIGKLFADDKFSIRLVQPSDCESRSKLTIQNVPAQQNRRRTLSTNWTVASKCPIVDLPGVRSRLTHLRMDNDCLMFFLQGDGLALDALRSLHIDFKSKGPRAGMLWPPDWLHTLSWREGDVAFKSEERSAQSFDLFGGYDYVLCDNLETITLFALDAAVRVASEEAAFLGHALSARFASGKERPVLSLAGVEFKEPASHHLLDRTYSRIDRHAFSGQGSTADKDGGLWDHSA